MNRCDCKRKNEKRGSSRNKRMQKGKHNRKVMRTKPKKHLSESKRVRSGRGKTFKHMKKNNRPKATGSNTRTCKHLTGNRKQVCLQKSFKQGVSKIKSGRPRHWDSRQKSSEPGQNPGRMQKKCKCGVMKVSHRKERAGGEKEKPGGSRRPLDETEEEENRRQMQRRQGLLEIAGNPF